MLRSFLLRCLPRSVCAMAQLRAWGWPDVAIWCHMFDLKQQEVEKWLSLLKSNMTKHGHIENQCVSSGRSSMNCGFCTVWLGGALLMCSVGCHANKVYIFQNGMAVVANHAKLLQLSLQTKITPAELGKFHCGLYDLWTSADHIPRASPRVFHICWMAEALGEPLVDLGSNHFKMAGGPTIPWIVRQVWCFGIIWFSDPRQLWDMGQRLLYIDSLRVQTCNTRMEPRMKNICITLYVFY